MFCVFEFDGTLCDPRSRPGNSNWLDEYMESSSLPNVIFDNTPDFKDIVSEYGVQLSPTPFRFRNLSLRKSGGQDVKEK